MPWPVSAQTYGSFQYLKREVGLYLDFGADESVWDHQQYNLVDSIVQRGIQAFYLPPVLSGEKYAHEWSFLKPLATMTTTAAYSTGTIGIVDGVVTLTGGTWPQMSSYLHLQTEGQQSLQTEEDEILRGELTVSGVTYFVAARNSNTQLTLEDTTVDVASGTSYTLSFPAYDLPSDFASLDGPITHQPGARLLSDQIDERPESWIRQRRQCGDITGQPTHYAWRPKAVDETVGTRYELLFWPTPDAAYQLTYRYRVQPAALDDTNNMPYGGTVHAPTWTEAVLAEAETEVIRRHGGRPVHYAKFMQRLASSISHDRRNASPDFVGYNGDRSDRIDMGNSLSDMRYFLHRTSGQIVTYAGT